MKLLARIVLACSIGPNLDLHSAVNPSGADPCQFQQANVHLLNVQVLGKAMYKQCFAFNEFDEFSLGSNPQNTLVQHQYIIITAAVMKQFW